MATTVSDRTDHGLLGPRSIAWTVIGHPMSLVGGLRALMIQALHPLAMAGVAQHSDYERRALDRLRRTAYYVTATTFGDTETAYAAAERVKRVHRRIHGVDPVTGRPYNAADPDTQIWVHCTEWHSLLAAYRVFGNRQLTPPQLDQYFAEGAIIGSLLDTPRERIPASHAECRAYFAAVRPQLCVSEHSRKAINFVLHPPVERSTLHLQAPMRLFASAALALIPRHLRRLAGIDRPTWQDGMAIAAVRPFGTVLTLPGMRDLPRAVFGGDVHDIALQARRIYRAG
ncbi:MAG TPA: oxygenase MpaB family protein [Pseudonocardiaceae bacterium]|jgi:uncharacterized protein (DUF2236 family)